MVSNLSPAPQRLYFERLDADAVGRLAASLAEKARPGDVLALYGALGAGKTAFARAFLRALGVRENVPSPTFTLVQQYEAALSGAPLGVWHFDLYRIENPEELAELGWDEALTDGVSLVEWPENAGRALPDHALSITLSISGKADDRRDIVVDIPESWHERLSGERDELIDE